ncbi:MAG: DUF6056 family protein [Leptolinea sp.]
MQLSFIFILALIIFSLLYFILGKLLDWLIHNYLFSASIISLIPLIAYSIIGSCSRFVADDFSSATLAVSKGVFGATWDWYIHWSGRFSASFFDSLVGYIGPGIAPYITGSAILIWLIALMSVTRHFFQSKSKLNRFAFSLLFSAWILITTFEVTPLLSQSLYWGQGMRSVILPLILATILVSILYYLIRIKGISPAIWLILVGAISFIAGGFGETYVTLQTSATLIMLLITFIDNPQAWRKNIYPVILVGLFGSILAMLITIAAPGNKIRQAVLPPPPDLFNLLKISAISFGEFIQFLGNSPTRLANIAALFILSSFLGSRQENHSSQILYQNTQQRISRFINKSYFRTILFISAISLILLYVCFIPAAYGMSTTPPERTLVIPTFILAISTSALGLISGRVLFLSLYSKCKTWLPPQYLKYMAWLIFLLFSFYTLNIAQNIVAILPDYRHFAKDFDRADVIIRQAKAEGQVSVMVPEVHNHFGLSDSGAGTTLWLDEAVNTYYGILVIVNKNMK